MDFIQSFGSVFFFIWRSILHLGYCHSTLGLGLRVFGFYLGFGFKVLGFGFGLGA